MVAESSRRASGNVEDLFKRRNLEAENVKLIVVNGVAYLDGTVASYHQKKALAAAVAALANVREVVNRLRVVPAYTRGDNQTREGLLEALRKDDILSLYPIGVSVNDGVVELIGKVGSLSGRIAAEATAWSVCGVRHVINHLEVAPEKALDARELSLALKRGLQSCLGPGGAGINVKFQRGAAYLQGIVPNSEQRLAAEDLIRWHPLVRQVVNQLRVAKEPLSDLPASA